VDAHRADTDGYRTRLEAHDDRLDGINEQFKSYASNDEVRGVMKDVLLVWSSIKQLDAAKADKTTLDAFVSEVTASQQQSTLKAEDLQAFFQNKVQGTVQEETLKVRGELDTKASHWEQMWGKVAGLVEDLLTKVEALQSTRKSSNQSHQSSKAAPAPPEFDAQRGDLHSNMQSTMQQNGLPPQCTFQARRSREGSASNLRSPSGGRGVRVAGAPAAAVAPPILRGSSVPLVAEHEASGSPKARSRKVSGGAGAAVHTIDGKGLDVQGEGPANVPAFRPARPSRPSSANRSRQGSAAR